MMACDPQFHAEVITDRYREKCYPQQNTTNGVSSSGTMEGGLQHDLGIQHRDTPPAGVIPYSRPAPALSKLSTMNEGNEEECYDGPFDNELSAEAQAHNISMFLSSSNSDSGEEPISETVITDVYKDPLEFCMEGIEEMARKILKTGRLAITGEPGDMAKIQPALFNLQPSEREMAQLLPQMLQVPFFCQGQDQLNLMDDDDFCDSVLTVQDTDESLANGNIRVAIPVDTAIYALLRSHCAKGARQAEEVINTAMNTRTTNQSTSSLVSLSTMPPIFKFQSNARQRHPNMPTWNGSTLQAGRNQAKHISSSSLSAESSSMGTTTSFSSLPRSDASDTNIASRKSSDEASTAAASHLSSTWPHQTLETAMGRTSTESPTPDSTARRIDSIVEEPEASTPKALHPQLAKSMSNPSRSRKTSTVIQPLPRTRGDSTGSDISLSESRFVPGSHSWNTSIVDNNTIVAQYGNMPYDLIWWDPSFKVDFRLSSSVGLLSGTVTGIDPSKPEVTLKVFNNSAKQIGFSIRSHRQSTIYSSHVVYPNKGLQILEPYKSWEDNVEFHPSCPSSTEMFVIDLFFCTMDSKPAWNVVRKYAIMKAQRSSSPNSLRRASKRRMSHLQLPGTKDQKSFHLELVLSHGLQCVVKGKLEEAETIFSQAVYMPDFQRVPLKAFVYICLAVTANKKLKQSGYGGGLTPVIKAVEASSKLVSICEQGPGVVKMPYTIQLVKQLKKELNIEKLMKDFMSKRGNKRASNKMEEQSIEEFKDITLDGKELTFKGSKVVIPPNALTHPTSISLSMANSKHLIPMLKASGWEKVVQVATAIHIECNPPLDRFNKPIRITTTLPKEMTPGPNSLVRLMHSNYLRHWEDITDDVLSKITVDDQEVNMETNLPGWLAISMIQFDPSMIAQMVLKSITMEPIMLRMSVFGFKDVERRSIQLAVFVVPCKGNEDPIHKEIETPVHFSPISFPHVVQAYPNERLQLAISGSFELDVSLGEESLVFEMDAQSKHNQIYTRWVKSTLDSDMPLSGKMTVSSCRNNVNSWESISDISLSMRSTSASSSGSASEL